MDTKNHRESFVDRCLQIGREGLSVNWKEVGEVTERVELRASGNQPTLSEWEMRRLYGGMALVGSERKALEISAEKIDLLGNLYKLSQPNVHRGVSGLSVEQFERKASEVRGRAKEFEKLSATFGDILSRESAFHGGNALKDPLAWRFASSDLSRIASNNEKNRDVSVLLQLSDWEREFNKYGDQQFSEKQLLGLISGRALTANIHHMEAQELLGKVINKVPAIDKYNSFAMANLKTAQLYDIEANMLVGREVSKLNGHSSELSFIQKPWAMNLQVGPSEGRDNLKEMPRPLLTTEQALVIRTFASNDHNATRRERYLEAVQASDRIDSRTYESSRQQNGVGERDVGGRTR